MGIFEKKFRVSKKVHAAVTLFCLVMTFAVHLINLALMPKAAEMDGMVLLDAMEMSVFGIFTIWGFVTFMFKDGFMG